MFFKLFDVSAEKEEMEWRGQKAAILNSRVFVYGFGFQLNFYFVCVFLTGDAADAVNAELATAGNGEVVGNMCNRSRYVLKCFSCQLLLWGLIFLVNTQVLQMPPTSCSSLKFLW